MKKFFLFMGWLICTSMYSQSQLTVFQDWSTTAGTQTFFQKSVTKTDGSGNVYVAGATKTGSGDYDILLAKYNSSGVQQWIAQYNGTANYHDLATGLFIDGSGNVYITGLVVNDTSTFTSDIITIKYNSSGTRQWIATYNGSGSSYDSGADLIVDGSGNVYITGTAYNTVPNTDAVTIKYNSSGTQQWIVVYNSTSNLNDAGVKINLNGTTVTITTAVQVSSTNYRHRTFDYVASTGVLLGGSISSSTSVTQGEATDIFRDALGNIYLTGGVSVTGQGYNVSTIKFDSTMALQWQRSYNGASNLDDFGNALQVDASGNVYVTGYTTDGTGGLNFATIKYNSSGTQQWVSIYNDSLNGKDEARAIALDNSGNVYVTGSAQTDAINGLNFYTIKYNSSGTVLWSIDADGDKHLDDKANNIAIDNSGDIIITGQSKVSVSAYEYKTIKYVEKNIITPTDYNSETPSNSFAYYENKGQLLGTNDSLVSDIRYYTNNTSPAYFIRDRNFSFVFAHVDTAVATTDTMHRIDLSFTGGHVSRVAKVYPMEKQADYLNYFLGHIPDGVTEVHGNSKLVSPDLFPNIDLQYSSNQNGFKYYFIVKPGGDPDDIQMEFTGASSFSLDSASNSLTVNSTVGSITFDRPTVYQLNSSNVIVPVTGWTADWQTNGASNKYKFNSGTYDSTKSLVIQVDIGNTSNSSSATGNNDWSTFYGGSTHDYFTDVRTDDVGNIYTTGWTASFNFPIVTGVLQESMSQIYDVVVIKFDGTTLNNTWATYYGGSGSEQGKGIAIGPGLGKNPGEHEVYVTGSTYSSDFPILNSPQSYGGQNDGFVFRLNSTGTAKELGCLFGGSGDEYFNAIALDGLDNIYLGGRKLGQNAYTIPLHAQTGTMSWSSGEGVIVKLGTDGTLKWATQIGNQYYTEILSIAVDVNDDIYMTGSTRTGFPITGGAYPTFLGNADAFLAKFNASNNNIAWSTYFGGNGDDVSTRVALKSTGDVAIGGYTLTPTSGGFKFLNYPPGGNTFDGGPNYGDGFIAIFSSSGTHLFGTYFGGNNDDRITGMCFDDSDRLFVTGGSNSSTNSWLIPSPNTTGTYNVTSNAGGAEDVFIAAFDVNYHQHWGTFFGGADRDRAFGAAVATDSYLYIVGQTESLGKPITGHFPLVEFDPVNHTDYYNEILNFNNSSNNGGDGFISRFGLANIPVVGIEESSFGSSNISVYPNPGNGQFNLSIRMEKPAKTITIDIYNLVGQKLHSETIINPAQYLYRLIELSYLSSGMYILNVKIDDNTYSKKLIKQ